MKMLILSKHSDYPGGVESVNRLLMRALSTENQSVTLISADSLPKSPFLNLAERLIGHERLFAKRIQTRLSAYDFVLANGEYGFGISHPSCVNLFHGSYFGYAKAMQAFLGPRSRWRLAQRAKLQKAAAKDKTVICVSEYIKTILEEQGVAVDAVIENCIDTDHFKPLREVKKKDRYLFVGSYDYFGKGFDVLQAIAEKGFGIDCFTKGPEVKGLNFCEQVTYQEMPRVYNHYKIMLFPSRFEGLQMAALEAMACGVPVVMSAVGLGYTLKRTFPELVIDGFDPEEYLERAKKIEERYDYYAQTVRDYVQRRHHFDRFQQAWIERISMIKGAACNL